ncbi:uncharacterized protein LOC117404476 isoform X2 [Acipenser ruthenus]|uniref:uncharacterized protein LOC117404476 isoform X2 n=1 Tax=Acipenser ruthenus TaxID=7906 RepID=UPI0027428B00|nr:uncharacterized protein LOC117404476 isoform X2 [Acipenser ruthenus]
MKPDTKACTSTFPARTLQREAEAHRAQDKTADKLQEKLRKWTIAMDQPQDSQPSAPLSPSVGQEGPAVAIRFEKAQNRIQKFTEGHPGSLGVTQIMVCLFHFGCIVIIFGSPFVEDWPDIAAVFLMLIAGALAIASDKTLRLPIIKACLGMEVLGSTFSGFMLLTHGLPSAMYFSLSDSHCHFHFENETYSKELKLCEKYNTIDDCIFMEMLFALAVQVAIGITIASYCCKAIQCCGAPRSVPVIVIQQPSEQTES